jgi:hypothetical protein
MIKITNKKRFFLIILTAMAAIAAAVWIITAFISPENKVQVYEALVSVIDEKSSDPVEDAKSSMKRGDVLVIFPEGHSWSETEKTSYLILKIRLKKSEADELVQPEIKSVSKRVAEGGAGKSGGLFSAKNKTVMQKEIIRPRKYRLKIEELNFDLQKMQTGGGQPFPDKIFDDSLIGKR